MFKSLFNSLFGRSPVKSRVICQERVTNRKRRFGANAHYYPAHVETMTGLTKRALFTEDQLAIAIQRAAANPEDF